jgi:hypothetical protein
MEYRWRHPELSKAAMSTTGLPSHPRVDDYVKRFPEVGTQGQIPASLITEEFRVRMKWGDQPDYSEYQNRFPDRKNSLAQQIDRVHDELAAEQNLDEPSPANPLPANPLPLSPMPSPKKPPSAQSPSAESPSAESPSAESPSAESPSAESPSAESDNSGLQPTLDIRPASAVTDTTSSSRSDKYTSRAEPKKGGMAIVWRAFDSRLNREVAYKELRPDRATDRDFLAMFLNEAQVTGQLEHPNIVPVYELGGDESDDRPFYTMKYVRGGTLSDAIADYHQRRQLKQADRLDLHRLLTIYLDVCHAIRYAHSRGVLHRDLKPDNVMVGDYGEVLVVDWGLAKVLGVSDADLPAVQLSRADRLYTEVGARKGTPAYWAPEQAEGRADLVDVRTDIYGLGGILFQILTGSIPHPELDGENAQANRSLETLNPCEIESSAPASLAAISVKAMAPQRSARYAKVDDLICDVERWRVDEPVSAYRESLPERAVRLVRRNWIASIISLVGIVAVVLVLTSLHIMRERSRNAIVAREIDTLSEFASSQEAKLMSRINVLRQDVAFLATLDQVHDVLKPDVTTDAKTDAKTNVEGIFRDFLKQRPEYMQLRLIHKNGQELVRVQRLTPDGNVAIQRDRLQNKRDRPYFKETMQIERGSWYLSSIELNQENGKKDKNLPVIRGAVPVFVDEDSPQQEPESQSESVDPTPSSGGDSLEGIVIINLHFRKLVTDLRDFEERSASGLVYLTDSEGRFLYHPNDDIAFSFERQLDYRLQQLYTPLNEAYTTGKKQAVDLDATPQIALFVKPDPDFVRDDPSIWKMINDSMSTALISIGTQYERVKSSQGGEGDAIIYGVSETELTQIGEQLKATLPIKVDTRIIGAKFADARQAVHYNRLSLEPGNDKRSLGLALVVPHESLDAESAGYRTIFWGTLLLLAFSITPLVYLVARRAPHAGPRPAVA